MRSSPDKSEHSKNSQEKDVFIKIDTNDSKHQKRKPSVVRESLELKNNKDVSKPSIMRLKTKKAKPKKSIKKPPLMPKNPLFHEITLKDDLKYWCRLNNHLTLDEIKVHLEYLLTQRIKTNSFVVHKQVKTPHISALDVYEKVVYDAVRRNMSTHSTNKQHDAIQEGIRRKSVLSRSEIQLLNVLIPKDKRKENTKKMLQNTEDISEDICKKELGESTYNDWYEVK